MVFPEGLVGEPKELERVTQMDKSPGEPGDIFVKPH